MKEWTDRQRQQQQGARSSGRRNGAGCITYHSVARLGAAAATALAACEAALRTVVAGVLALDRADRRGRGCSG